MSQNIEAQNSILQHLDSIELQFRPIIQFKDNIEDVAGESAKITASTSTNYLTVESKPNNELLGVKFGENQYFNEPCDFIITTIIVLFYSIVLILFKKQFLTIISTFKSRNIVERLYDLMDVNSIKFINFGLGLFIISFSYLLTNALSLFIEISIDKLILFTAILVVILVSTFIRWVINRGIDYITMGRNSLDGLNILYKSYFSSISIILTPFTLSSLYFTENQPIIGSYLLGLVVVMTIAFYLFYSAAFFFKQKISFLEYILYLCSAEIIPIATILIFLIKKFM